MDKLCNMDSIYYKTFTTVFMILSRYLEEPELIRMILYKFKGVQNIGFIQCFNEFNRLELLDKTGSILPIDYYHIIECSNKFIRGRQTKEEEYRSSKKIKLLILKRIFQYRLENNMDTKIFNFRCQHKHHYRCIYRTLPILKPRKIYLLKKNRASSLITKLLLYPNNINIGFSSQFLQIQIENELNIKIDHLYYPFELIKLYMKS